MGYAARTKLGSTIASCCILLALGGVTACAESTSSRQTPTSTESTVVTGHNQHDVTFASQVAELSQQLNTVVDIMIGRNEDAAVESQLSDLSRAARERVALCRSWLHAWGAANPIPAPAPDLASDELIEQLIVSDGPEFAAAFGRFATGQQAGVQAAAAAETASGSDRTAVDYARGLPTTSRQELAELTELVAPEKRH